MFCPNCGKEVAVKDNYCPQCGKEVSPFADAAKSAATDAQPTATAAQPAQPPITVTGNTPDTDKFTRFGKAGFWLSIAQICCLVLTFVLAVSLLDKIDLNNPDFSAYMSELMWVGLTFIATLILGVLGIVFSAIAVGKQTQKSGMTLAGLILSVIFTLICIIILISGS